MAGMTTTGYDNPTLATIRAEIETRWRLAFGAGTKTDANSPDGKEIDIIAFQVKRYYDLGEGAYNALNPDNAGGTVQDHLFGLLGLTRLPATKSTVPVNLVGTPLATVAAGATFQVSSTEEPFTLDANVTLDGAGLGSGTATATNTGPVAAATGSLTVIPVPVPNLSTVTNPSDATLGRNVETDGQFRARRAEGKSGQGMRKLDTLRQKILEGGATECEIHDNDTDTVDADGRPAWHFEVVHLGGTTAALAAIILEHKPAGSATHGTTTENVADNQGDLHAIKLTTGTTVAMYLDLTLTVDSDYPADGDTQVKNAIVTAMTAEADLGRDAYIARVSAAIYGVTGVLSDVTKMGTAPTPTGTVDVPIAYNQIASWDASRITVTS